jgi:preprotein translocase subunit SecE
MDMFEIYKRGQGKYTRIFTVVGVMLVGVLGALVLSGKLEVWLGGVELFGIGLGIYLAYGIPALLVIVLAALMFWLINRPQTADFLIATESEMKKVSWSSKKEIIGSTKVVIITTFILAGLLFGVDAIFAVLFKAMGIMG